MNDSKYYGLDLLRGIAGYGVAITHYLYFVKQKVDFEYYSFIFVEIFFVLSGFVLSKQLIKIHKEKKHIKIFYLRRWFRTIPLYLIALIFYTAISNNFNFDCIQLFSYDMILPYLLKKKFCTKYNFLFIANSDNLQNDFIILTPRFSCPSYILQEER